MTRGNGIVVTTPPAKAWEMVVHHAVDRQVFNGNDTEPINNLTTILMCEVLTSPCNTLMDPSHGFTMLATLGSPLFKPEMLPLHFRKRFFFLTKEARVLNLFTCRQGSISIFTL